MEKTDNCIVCGSYMPYRKTYINIGIYNDRCSGSLYCGKMNIRIFMKASKMNEMLKKTDPGRPYSCADHTFVVCAYGRSVFTEECIRSLEAQKLKSRIIMATSTPSPYLEDIASKHGIELFVNKEKTGRSNIASDWNYAVKVAGTRLVTIAHQDDIYKPDYLWMIMDSINRADNPLIAFTDYAELRNGREVSNVRNLKIKRIMLFPLRLRKLWGSVFIRRRILSLGSPICCPSVTYVTANLPDELFLQGYKVNLDWQAWERFSRLQGDFVFVSSILMAHRIHEESETTRNIVDNNRSREDYDMFLRFWPGWMARFIEYWYKNSEEQNHL